MPMKYKLLCKGGDILHRNRIYMAEDHILYVISNGYTEEYRRFFLKDIQYIVVCQTRIWWINTAIWAVVGAAVLPAMVLAANEIGGMWASIVAVLGFVPLLVNFLLGASAVAVIKTTTSEEKISLAPRYRASLKALAAIKGAVEGVQGRLDRSLLKTGAAQEG